MTLAINKLVEPAFLAVLGAVLVQESEAVLVEDPEKFGPVEFFQPFVPLLEVHAQDAAAFPPAGAVNYSRGPSAALLDPASDLVVIGGLRCRTHGTLHLLPWNRFGR